MEIIRKQISLDNCKSHKPGLWPFVDSVTGELGTTADTNYGHFALDLKSNEVIKYLDIIRKYNEIKELLRTAIYCKAENNVLKICEDKIIIDFNGNEINCGNECSDKNKPFDYIPLDVNLFFKNNKNEFIPSNTGIIKNGNYYILIENIELYNKNENWGINKKLSTLTKGGGFTFIKYVEDNIINSNKALNIFKTAIPTVDIPILLEQETIPETMYYPYEYTYSGRTMEVVINGENFSGIIGEDIVEFKYPEDINNKVLGNKNILGNNISTHTGNNILNAKNILGDNINTLSNRESDIALGATCPEDELCPTNDPNCPSNLVCIKLSGGTCGVKDLCICNTADLCDCDNGGPCSCDGSGPCQCDSLPCSYNTAPCSCDGVNNIPCSCDSDPCSCDGVYNIPCSCNEHCICDGGYCVCNSGPCSCDGAVCSDNQCTYDSSYCSNDVINNSCIKDKNCSVFCDNDCFVFEDDLCVYDYSVANSYRVFVDNPIEVESKLNMLIHHSSVNINEEFLGIIKAYKNEINVSIDFGNKKDIIIETGQLMVYNNGILTPVYDKNINNYRRVPFGSCISENNFSNLKNGDYFLVQYINDENNPVKIPFILNEPLNITTYDNGIQSCDAVVDINYDYNSKYVEITYIMGATLENNNIKKDSGICYKEKLKLITGIMKTFMDGYECDIFYEKIDFNTNLKSIYKEKLNRSVNVNMTNIIGMNCDNFSITRNGNKPLLFTRENDNLSSFPKTDFNIVFNRGNAAGWEKHFKLSECNTMQDLINYGNNFFNL